MASRYVCAESDIHPSRFSLAFPSMLSQVFHLLGQGMGIDVDGYLHFLVLRTVEFSQPIDNRCSVLSRHFDLFKKVHQFLVVPPVLGHLQEEFGKTKNRGEQIVEVVSDAAGHLAQGAKAFLLVRCPSSRTRAFAQKPSLHFRYK